MKNVIQLGRADNLDPKSLLLHVLEEVDDYESIVVIARKKDDGPMVWTTSRGSWFLWGASCILADLAHKCLNGVVIPEGPGNTQYE